MPKLETCIAALQAIVDATHGQKPLERRLFDKYKPNSYLNPHAYDVDARLIEQAMLALDLPVPAQPKHKKIPVKPTNSQQAVLSALTQGEVLRRRDNWSGGYTTRVNDQTVHTATFDTLLDYRWIERVTHTASMTEYTITQAGREALARYKGESA